MNLSREDLFSFLEEKYDLYDNLSFIGTDPVSIPHLFSLKEDIEIAAFLTATITWGIRKTIIANATLLMKHMDYHPFDFILNAGNDDLGTLRHFKHRTFNGDDCLFFIRALKNIYLHHGGLEQAFAVGIKEDDQDVKNAILHFRHIFMELPHSDHASKHVSDPGKNSAAKRLNMFLRWMVRQDKRGVDFGLWKKIQPAQLCCPLDVHSGRVARSLGLLSRKANDWQAVEELTANLRLFDPVDPVKYDYALFGLGAFEKF
jgi:uncharacterized protein (TIGR02757 family)